MGQFLLRHVDAYEEEREFAQSWLDPDKWMTVAEFKEQWPSFEPTVETRTVTAYKARYERVEGKREDFPEYETITLNRGKPDKEVTILMARPKPRESAFDPYGLVGMHCPHGLLNHPDGRPMARGAQSWIPGRYVEIKLTTRFPQVKCVMCWGEVRPDDFPGDPAAVEAAKQVFADAL